METLSTAPFCFVAFLGLQPAATAIKLATLARMQLFPAQILLGVNQRTAVYYEHLKHWWCSQGYPEIQWETCLDTELISEAEQIEQQLVFDADSGYATNIVRFLQKHHARALWCLNTEVRQLLISHVAQNQTHKIPLEHLGLAPLLALYGLAHQAVEPSAYFASEEQKTFWGLLLPVLENSGLSAEHYALPLQLSTHPITYDLAFEAYGRLYLFKMLWKYKAQSNTKLIHEIRRYLGHEINGLAVQTALGLYSSLCALADEKTLLDFKHLEQICKLSPHVQSLYNLQDLENWLTPDFPPPELVVALGTNLSSTHRALLTHRPRKAWIIYERENPLIASHCKTLRQICSDLNIYVSFIATSFTGYSLAEQLQHLPDYTAAPLHFETGPGSKIQSRIMTEVYLLLAAKMYPVELWCANFAQGKTANLSTGEQRSLATIPIQTMIDIFTQDQGTQTKPNTVSSILNLASPNDANTQFLDKIFRSFLGEVMRGSKKCTAPYNLEQVTQKFEFKAIHSSRARFCYLYKPTNGSARSFYSALPQIPTGTWFEYVVAAQLAKHCGEQVWHSLRSYTPSGQIRCELDIVAAWQDKTLVVSCKSGAYNSLYSTIFDSSSEIEISNQLLDAVLEIRAEARLGFGYKAVPILVIPFAEKSLKDFVTQTFPELILWDLRDLEFQTLEKHLSAL